MLLQGMLACNAGTGKRSVLVLSGDVAIMTWSPVVCLAALALALAASARAEPSAVKEIAFTDLVDASGDRVALFYFSSEGLHGPVLELMEAAAAALAPTYPRLKWNKVDGDASEENAAEFESVGGAVAAEWRAVVTGFGSRACRLARHSLRCAAVADCTNNEPRHPTLFFTKGAKLFQNHPPPTTVTNMILLRAPYTTLLRRPGVIGDLHE
jgi:hypothetical protein